jgi:5-methylthioadenosine/S-adenosylhomocysteine deaminase
MRQVEKYNDLGVLGPRFQAAGAVAVTDREIKILKETQTPIIHIPFSNMEYAEGVAPIPKMMDAGITIGLGTNARSDMITAMRVTALLHRVTTMNPGVISERDVLEMATINGARALSLNAETGSLDVGKKADITIIDLKKPHIVPVHHPVDALVWAAQGNDVDTVIVDGNIIMENRVMKTVREEEIIEKAQERAIYLAKKLPPRP